MAGAPPPVSYRKLVSALFQNLRYDYDRSAKEAQIKTFYFAEGALSRKQAAQITYPEGLKPLNQYITYQINLTRGQFRTYVVALAKGKGGYIYGVYYRVPNAPKLKRRYIRDSPTPITLPKGVVLVDYQYLELYTQVESTPVILGLRRRDTTAASLQFSNAAGYYTANIDAKGLVRPLDPKVEKLGLSRNFQSGDRK